MSKEKCAKCGHELDMDDLVANPGNYQSIEINNTKMWKCPGHDGPFAVVRHSEFTKLGWTPS